MTWRRQEGVDACVWPGRASHAAEGRKARLPVSVDGVISFFKDQEVSVLVSTWTKLQKRLLTC